MTITSVPKDELEETATDWSNVDTVAVRQMIAEADAEGGEFTRDEVERSLEMTIESVRPPE